MPTFDTPEPISIALELGIANVRIDASERHDTVVDVRPSDPAKRSDVAAAAQTRVEYANGALLVRSPRGWKQWTPWGGHESIDVHIELPEGSGLRGTAGVASLRCTGAIGELHYRTGVGDVALERAGSVELRSGTGDVTVDLIEGRAEIKTAGSIRIRTIEGAATIKNSNGDTWVGSVAGDARVNASNGSIALELARSGVVAKTANGDVRIDEVEGGTVVAQSALGTVDVGIPQGVAVWLDLETKFGNVRNELSDARRPEPGEATIEVHAQTSMGDITIRRAFASTGERRES